MTLSTISRQKLAKFARRFGAELVILFGSSNDPRRKPRDVDIALLLSQAKREKYEKDIGAYTDLWRSLGQGLGVSEDLLDITFISPRTSPLLLYKLAIEGKILWGSARKFAELRLYAWKQYQDTEYFRKLLDISLKRKLKLYA